VRELGEDILFAQDMASSSVLSAQTLASNSDLCIGMAIFMTDQVCAEVPQLFGGHGFSPLSLCTCGWCIYIASYGIVQCTVIFFQSFSLNFLIGDKLDLNIHFNLHAVFVGVSVIW